MPIPIPRFLQSSTARYANYQRRINALPIPHTPANLATINRLVNALLAQVESNRRLEPMHRTTLRTLAEKTRARRKAGYVQRRQQRPNAARNRAQANRLVANAQREVAVERDLMRRLSALRRPPSPPRRGRW